MYMIFMRRRVSVCLKCIPAGCNRSSMLRNNCFRARRQRKFWIWGAALVFWQWSLFALTPAVMASFLNIPEWPISPRTLVAERGLADYVSVVAGNFNADDIGVDYDVIIASGILDFAKEHLDAFLKKLHRALTPNGYLYLVAHATVSDDYQSPPESILGWLSGNLEGLDAILTKKTIDDALSKQGFRLVQTGEVGGAFKGLYGEFYCKQEADGA